MGLSTGKGEKGCFKFILIKIQPILKYIRFFMWFLQFWAYIWSVLFGIWRKKRRSPRWSLPRKIWKSAGTKRVLLKKWQNLCGCLGPLHCCMVFLALQTVSFRHSAGDMSFWGYLYFWSYMGGFPKNWETVSGNTVNRIERWKWKTAVGFNESVNPKAVYF